MYSKKKKKEKLYPTNRCKKVKLIKYIHKNMNDKKQDLIETYIECTLMFTILDLCLRINFKLCLLFEIYMKRRDIPAETT